MIYLIAFCALVGVGLLVAGLRESKVTAEASSAARMERIKERGRKPSADEIRQEEEREFARREEERVTANARSEINHLPSVSRAVSSHALLTKLEQDLMQVKSRWRASEVLAFSFFAALFVTILLLRFGLPTPLAILVGVLFLGVPWLYVKIVRARYYRTFDEQLSDTLMLMANSLKAGFSFPQSLEMVSRECKPPIGDEFGRVTQEMAVGVPLKEALLNLAGRVKSMDLQLLVTAVLIQREVGGGLAEILETIANVIQERMKIKREIRVLTTQGRATGAILSALPITLGLAIHLLNKMSDPLSPSFIQPLFETSFGRNLLYVGLALQAIGFAVIMRIVSIRV